MSRKPGTRRRKARAIQSRRAYTSNRARLHGAIDRLVVAINAGSDCTRTLAALQHAREMVGV